MICLTWVGLTGFSGLLARPGFRRGLAGHKEPGTQSSGPEKPASGGPYRLLGVVPALARYLHIALRAAPGRMSRSGYIKPVQVRQITL